MKEIVTAGLIAASVLTATMAKAGGPVLIEEGNNELIEEAPAKQRIGLLPVLGLIVLVGLVAGAGGGGSDPAVFEEVKK